MFEESELERREIEALKEKYGKQIAEDELSNAFVLLGEILRKQGELEKAYAILTRGLVRNPKNITARCVLGKIYFERWKIDQAKKEMEMVVGAIPDNLDASKILIEIYVSEGTLQKALDIAYSAYVFHPEDVDIGEKIKELKAEIDHSHQSRQRFLALQNVRSPELLTDEEIDNLPGFSDQEIFTETMGDIYINQGLYDDAVRIFEGLLKREPDNQSIRKKLSRIKPFILSKKAGFEI